MSFLTPTNPSMCAGSTSLSIPGRYAYPPAARIIRVLNLAGALLLAVGLSAVFYGIVQSVRTS